MTENVQYHGSDEDHGGSVAAWTGVLILLVASALVAIGVYINQDIITIAGVVVGVVGMIGAVVLSKLGFGVEAKRRQSQSTGTSDGRDAVGHG